MKNWVFDQALSLQKKVENIGVVIFATGFGPSGEPTLATKTEPIRSNMVRHAFEELTNGKILTRLVSFSDDYDGFRRVPENIPEDLREKMKEDLGKPLTSVRDPYNEFPSFAHRNNQVMRNFLDNMEIGYEFLSATEQYKSGRFNNILRKIAENYDAITAIMLPTLGEARRATYSPFMPISAAGNVLQTGVKKVDAGSGKILFLDEFGKEQETSIFDGNVKLQWKIDWAARWCALGVNYEMHGKDLKESAIIATKFCKILGMKAPVTFTYEMFLDEDGHKISKSVGNGFTMEEWLKYSTLSTLSYFMYQSPTTAKPIGPSIIPRVTDDYLKSLFQYKSMMEENVYDSPVWHVHEGSPPEFHSDISYSLLLNLAEVSGAKDSQTLLNYLGQYKAINENDLPLIKELVKGAIAYTREQSVKKVYRKPSSHESIALTALAMRLTEMSDEAFSEDYQYEVYEIGKEFKFDPLKSWFDTIYQVIFGADKGPRLGSFIAAYGRERSVKLILDAARR